MKKRLLPGLFCLLLLPSLKGFLNGQELPEPWIAYPTASVTDYGVFHFRKAFELTEVPATLVIHVSADNRYQLFVNGQRVSYGPAKGDLETYKYDVVDIAPYLVKGQNQLASLVFNGGKDKALSLLSAQTAFLLRAEEPAFDSLNTDASWKVWKNGAYTPVTYQEMLFDKRWFYGFYACGPGDRVESSRYPWGWEDAGFEDGHWKHAEPLQFDGKAPWNLVPRNIAFMDSYEVQPERIRLVQGASGADGFLEGLTDLVVPPGSRARILFDYEIFTMGYPELRVRGGAGSTIRIRYAEALYEKVNLKAHRDSVEGKTMYGVWDVFRPDGGERIFRPLWKRTFRYVQVEVETAAEALEILSLKSQYSGYPYPDEARFKCNDPALNEIFEMSLRTLRMCSGETYYDTPFYEQLSYGGDNRPIGALSTYTSTDDRLLREVLRLYPQSANQETKLFKSAYPSRFTFDMGSWSLAWIQSLKDYYQVRGDADFVRQFVEDIEGVLGFFHRHMDEEAGILGAISCRNFMDWSITKGSIPRRVDGIIENSTMLTLYYLHTLDCVTWLYREIGEEARAIPWEDEADGIREAILKTSFDEEKQLFTDYPGESVYSQHSNILAILCDVLDEEGQAALMERILTYDGFDERASSYFSFLLFMAMEKTGMQDRFLDNLGFWHQFIARGLTTCGETGFASHDRSDCHAWSAHPAYYLLRMVCGIRPASVGFGDVLFEPHLGGLESVEASLPHPKGRIGVLYQMKKGKLHADISLPEGMQGTFRYGDHEVTLNEGQNSFRLK